MRVRQGVKRGDTIGIRVDGAEVAAFAGETVAAAMLAAGLRVFRHDPEGFPRAPFCNMGICYDCLLEIAHKDALSVRLRACMTLVSPGMSVTTGCDGKV